MKKSLEIFFNAVLAMFANVLTAGVVAFILDHKDLGFWLFYGGLFGFCAFVLLMFYIDS